MKTTYQLIEGLFFWTQKEYQNATITFLTATEEAKMRNDTIAEQYGLYALASTYITQNETDAALERLSKITSDAPKEILFASLYNAGIIAYKKQQYTQAATLFKEALLIEPSSIDAKINLELSTNQYTATQESQKQEVTPIQQSTEKANAQDALFSAIKAKEHNVWKNIDQTEPKKGGIDY